MTEFDTSLSVGKLREAELIEFFQSKGHKPIPIPGKFSGFDFFLANTKQGYEVKQDWKAHYSGNLVVEVEMYGKRSGLMATTADWWIFDTVQNPNIGTQNRLGLSTGNAVTTNVASGADNVDLLSNGFKMVGLGGGANSHDLIYMYVAFAESPFVTSGAAATTGR